MGKLIAKGQVTITSVNDGIDGKSGKDGIDANMLDWVKDWNSNKTLIGSKSVITPKIFAGIKNVNGTLTGLALGSFEVNALDVTGSAIPFTVNGIYSFKDGENTFFVDCFGNAQLGRNTQFIKYNSANGKIEFGSDVSLNWVNAINTAKSETISIASADATAKSNKAKTDALSDAAKDASFKATQAKNDAIADTLNKINALQIGGSNLLNNSGDWRVAAWNNGMQSNGGGYTIDLAVLYNGKPSLKTLLGSGLSHPWVKLENNIEYTYSAIVKSNETIVGTGNMPFHYHSGKDNINQNKISILKYDTSVVSNQWKKISITFKLTGDADSFRPFFYRGSNGTTIYWIAYLKLERGNIATDWSASVSDITANIFEAQKAGENAQAIADSLVKKSNDEKWSSKLTYIDANGIFTGTLSANIINGIKINASQITAGTIDVARINVSALKASLITAANIEALTMHVSKGKIGCWSIDGDSIFSGTKSNGANTFTNASGAITLGSNGIRGFKWRLESSGSGALAGGNISWDTAGTVTFGASVTLNWTNAANNALNSAKTYADTKKTEAINQVTPSIQAARDIADKNQNALGGASYPKLTQITSTGIYTGTLNATQITAGTIHVDRLDANSIKAGIINTSYINGLILSFDKGKIGGWTIGADTISVGAIGAVGAMPIQIRSSTIGTGHIHNGQLKPYGLTLSWFQNSNAGHFVFGQVMATGNTIKTGFIGIQMMAWDNTEYFCLASNFTKSGAKEVYNRIAGWAFDNTRIWKNNVSLGADGSIANGAYWKLNNDGSGQIANGNISWNAAGTVSFSASVSLSWTNIINSIKTDLQGKIDNVHNLQLEGLLYCRGTGLNRNASRLLTISGKTIYSTTTRGLQLTAIKRSDLSIFSNVSYDVYVDAVKRSDFVKALNALTDAYIVVITSYDAITIDSTMTSAMCRCGGSGITLSGRYPYALVGIPGIGKACGIEVYYGLANTDPYAEITTKIINGNPVGINTLGGMALGNAAVAQSTADAITKKANDEKWGTKLTYIDANGIFTGTLSANIVNALKLNASQIIAGTISADRIAAGSINSSKLDANSIKANVINTGYINGLSLTFDKGKIGGWTIGADTISVGAIGTIGAMPIQLRSSTTGSGYIYSGQLKPYGLTLSWHQNNNAGHFVFGQVMATGNTIRAGFIGIQMMAWDNTEYFCLASNFTKSGAKEVYNRIAGWAFDNTRIWKNNVSLGADGSISNGTNWKLNNDGSGQIANGNIVWNTAGAITFASSVSLNWTNAANNALNSAKSYADTKKTEAINTAASHASNKADAAKELAQAMAFGKMLYRDPTFYVGNNGINVYNNSNNGTVTLVRTNDVNAPNDSKLVLVIKNAGASSPNCGGFHFSTPTANRKVFITRLIAKIPLGRSLSFHSNSIGTGGIQKWLSPVGGTGDWCEYICKVSCGTANFLSTHFFAITGAVGTAAAPVEWRVAYATVFDLTSTEKYTTTIDGNGIYTGTIRANQMLIDSALVVGGSSYNGSISVRDASNGVKVSLDRSGITAVAGTIGGWSIASNQISKNSVTLGADGTISNGTKWKFANDGSGFVANGNVSWTNVGAVSVTGTINATSGNIGGFTISGNSLTNNALNSSLVFDTLSGASSVGINASVNTLLSLRADSARTAISIQTYATGAKGISIIANSGSSYAIESYGPHMFGQRYGEKWSAPGVLFSAICKMSSVLYNQWGNGLNITSFYKSATGKYVCNHNLGHTQYTVLTTPYWDHSTNGHNNTYVRVEYLSANSFELRLVNADNGGYTDTCFSFAIIGRNRIN